MIIVPRNWQDFQHYKDRCPPWIKLHHSILDNYEFHMMQDASKSLAMCLWLIASENLDGHIDANPSKLAFRLRTSTDKIEKSLNQLIENNFFIVVQDATTPLANCKQDAPLDRGETETETETEKARATRLPADWVMPAEYGNWALAEKPLWTNDDVLRIAADFKDYWIAAAGANAAKRDWFATWRRWVRKQK